jgi:hypothetical protein
MAGYGQKAGEAGWMERTGSTLKKLFWGKFLLGKV